MKYVNFRRVTIKNFLSVGEEPVVVEFNTGLNVITGNNKDKVDRRNGVGKSTVADGIYFAIFGETLRTLKKDHIVNNVTQRGCELRLDFDINKDGETDQYSITRFLNPSKCYLYKNGEDITRDTIQNTTVYIQHLLNTTPEVFQNCVIMTINNAVPFMAKKKLEKRKFIEGIFNLKVFSDMLTDVRQEFSKVSKELDVECARYEEISNTLNSQQEQKSNQQKDKQRALDKLQARRNNCDREINTLSDKQQQIEIIDTSNVTSTINQLDEATTKIDSKLQKLMQRRTECVTVIDMQQQKKNRLSDEHSTCPTCLNKLDDTHRELIQTEKDKLQNNIDKLQQEQKNLQQEIKQTNELKTVVAEKRSKQTEKLQRAQIEQNNARNLKQQIEQLQSQLRDIDDDIKSLDKTNNNFDKMIEDTTTRLEKVQQVIDNVKNEMAKLDIIKFVVSEEGVKSYIVKKILQLFNAKLSYYLKKMDSNCICVFNEYFEEEIIDERGKPCSYFNFSGAERKNIDLACLFTFMDIRRLQGDVAFNLSMYDELFDSSLDERGVELVIDILNERIDNYNECVIVISHRKESTKLATGEVIFLEKQNGVTTRVETPKTELK